MKGKAIKPKIVTNVAIQKKISRHIKQFIHEILLKTDKAFPAISKSIQQHSLIRLALRRIYRSVSSKANEELSFWKSVYKRDGFFHRDFYESLILESGGLDDIELFRDKIVVDIGCGPRGSLTWATMAKMRIGIDPLVEQYSRFGFEEHKMLYIAAAGEWLPLLDESVDIVISMNALDHVDDALATMREIRRVLKPGGTLIGSFNLRHAPTITEPCVFDLETLETNLFDGWICEYSMIRPEGESLGGVYRFFQESEIPVGFEPEFDIVRCRYQKP